MAPTYWQFADIDVILNDPSSGSLPLTFGTTTVKCFFDDPDDAVLNADIASVYGRLPTVYIKTGSLPGLGVTSDVTIDSVPYKVTEIRQVSQGMTRLYVAAP